MNNKPKFDEKLSVQRNVILAPYTWWKIGGAADYFVEVRCSQHLLEALNFVRSNHIPFCIVGQGTNLLFDDLGYRGCVIRIGTGLSRIEHAGDCLMAEAGCWIPRLALVAARSGLSGLEHAIGIPASVGGLVCMNGGSQRKNIGSLVESVRVICSNGSLRTDIGSKCEFGYRKSRYWAASDIILSVTLRFADKRPYQVQRLDMLEILRDRSRKFPRKMPSCGSVFKSSPELYAACGAPGKIIEELGFKGERRGQIQVSVDHANFIVNSGGGSSQDVLCLVREIHDAVLKETGFSMEPEFRYLDPHSGFREFQSCI